MSTARLEEGVEGISGLETGTVAFAMNLT